MPCLRAAPHRGGDAPGGGPGRPAGGLSPPGAVPYRSLVPLEEIIAQALGQGRDTKGVRDEYLRLVSRFGSEFRILLDLPEEELAQRTPPRIVTAIRKVRAGELEIRPGYDGVYGEIVIPLDEGPQELSLF